MKENIYEILLELKKENIPAYLITVIKTGGTTSCRVGAKMVFVSDGRFYGTIGGGEAEYEVVRLLKEKGFDRPQILKFNLLPHGRGEDEDVIDLNSMCKGYVELFVEPIHSEDTLYIIGGGHCAMELSPLANRCGFYVVVIDHRKDWASKDKHPYADRVIVCDYGEIEKYIEFSNRSYVVVMTTKHQFDEFVISKLLGKELKYLGFMGSKFKVNEVFKNLRKKGFNESDLKKIYAPIGFPINSKTPLEIAISIMAQIIAVRNDLKDIKFSSNPLLK